MTVDDRLAEIKGKYKTGVLTITEAGWLIAEVERLRADNESLKAMAMAAERRAEGLQSALNDANDAGTALMQSRI